MSKLRALAYGTSLPLIPEMGAVCGKAARTDLCGGREVTRVPTATGASWAHSLNLSRANAFFADRHAFSADPSGNNGEQIYQNAQGEPINK